MSEDKQFDASPRRKQQAREKGQTPRSRDLTSAGVLMLAVMSATSWFPRLSQSLLRASENALGHLNECELTTASLRQTLLGWLAVYLQAVAPLLLIVIVGAILLTAVQGGLALSLHPLLPRADKLNPLTAIKRLFSAQGLVETVKSLLKVLLVTMVAWVILRTHMPGLLLLGQMEPQAAFVCVGRLGLELCRKTAMVMIVLGSADYLWQRFDFLKSLKMTRDEMKQETRETEGDPHVKGQRRHAREKLLRDGIAAKLPQATVVLTNPTHLAVALYYATGQAAPVVVARGRGRLAERIKQLARRYDVPTREHVPLARALYAACPLGSRIPPGLYQAVAVILAELYRDAAQRQEQRRRARLPFTTGTPR